MIWRRYNWLSEVVLPLVVALLRVLWLAAWLELVRRWLSPLTPAPILSLPAMLAVYLASVLLTRRLSRASNLALARLALVAAGFAAILMAMWQRFAGSAYLPWQGEWLHDVAAAILQTENQFAPALLALPPLVYLWLQGIFDGRQPLYRDDVWNAFAAGFLGLVLAAIAAPLDGRGQPAGMSGTVLAFFATGMAALAIASIETEQRAGRLAPDRYWLISVVSVVAVLLGLGLALSVLITPDLIARALAWTSVVVEVIGRIVYYVILVIAYIVFSLLEPLLNALNREERPKTPGEPTPVPDFKQQLQDLPHGQATLPPAILSILPWLGVAALVLAIGLAFALALRRWQRAERESGDETRELILSRALLARQAARVLGKLRPPAAEAPGVRFLSLEGESDTRRAIRSLYQALLAAMAERGRPRRPGQTPAEYTRDVQAAAPSTEDALRVVTSAYEQARYGAQSPDQAQARAAQQAWKDIEAGLPQQDATSH